MWPEFYAALELIDKVLQKPGTKYEDDFATDGTKNVMWRGNTPVIIDPFWDMGAIYQV